MATVVVQSGNAAKTSKSLPGRRYDHVFFSTMALLMLATVLLGFARTYFLAGVFRAPLPSLIIHIHGAAFSCWIFLLVAQTSLVSAGRVDIHRRLGMAGFLLACSMVILGVAAATDSLAHGRGPGGADPKMFYIVPITDMLIFAILIFLGFRYRSNSATHKRLIFAATVSLMLAAIARWPIAFLQGSPIKAGIASYVFLAILAVYDFWSTRKVHPATLWASAFLIFVQLIRLPAGKTVAWLSFAGWVQASVR